MRNLKNRNYTLISYCLIAIILIWVSANRNWGDGRWNNIVSSDGNGYYAYLPAIFIYHDLKFDFIDDISSDSLNSNIKKDFILKLNGNVVNKYYIGTSLTLIPFFASGHLSNIIYGYPLDGYSVYYRIFVQIGTIFYALMGLFLLIKIFRFYNISDKIIAISLLAIVFGTNMFHYIVSEPSMSHIYSFAFVNLFVYSFLKFFSKNETKYFLLGTFALAIITLIRPVNILVVLSLPFLAQNPENISKGMKYLIHNRKVLIIGVVLFTSLVMIQLIVYKIQTGKFIIYSYYNEGFNFLDPHLIDFMFSYKKGFFIYTPILFLSIFGLIYLYKDKFRFYALLIFLSIVVYVLSSWWQWYYGGSFSQRVMIEYYVYFFILFSLLLQKSKITKLLTTVTIILIIVCQIQTYQYKNGYIHWSEMNKQRYWDNFLRIDKVINKAEKEWG